MFFTHAPSVSIYEADNGACHALKGLEHCCILQYQHGLCQYCRTTCISQDRVAAGSHMDGPLQAAYLMRKDGLFVGSSAAMNCVGAVKLARSLGPDKVIVTILCDGGQR